MILNGLLLGFREPRQFFKWLSYTWENNIELISFVFLVGVAYLWALWAGENEVESRAMPRSMILFCLAYGVAWVVGAAGALVCLVGADRLFGESQLLAKSWVAQLTAVWIVLCICGAVMMGVTALLGSYLYGSLLEWFLPELALR